MEETDKNNMDELGAVGPDPLECPLMTPNIDNNESEDPCQEEWMDMKELRNLSLEDVQAFPTGDWDDEEEKDYVPVRKVVVRRLPPQISLKEFLRELPEVPKYKYIRVSPPPAGLPSNIEERSSIFIYFYKEQEAFWFKEKYNGKIFFDDKGKSYTACINYAFFQDLMVDPPADPEMGVLEESEIYRRFLRTYEENPRSLTMKPLPEVPSRQAMIDEIRSKTAVGGYLANNSTPVSEFLREQAKKQAEMEKRKRDKEDFRKKQKEDEKIIQRQKEEDATKRKLEEKERLLTLKHSSETKSGGQDHQNGGEEEKEGQPGKSFGKGTVAYSKSNTSLKMPENRALREGLKAIEAEIRRSQERINRINKSKKSQDKLETEKGINNNARLSSTTIEILKPKFGNRLSEDSDSSSNTSQESVSSVRRSNRASVPATQRRGGLRESQNAASSKSEGCLQQRRKTY